MKFTAISKIRIRNEMKMNGFGRFTKWVNLTFFLLSYQVNNCGLYMRRSKNIFPGKWWGVAGKGCREEFELPGSGSVKTYYLHKTVPCKLNVNEMFEFQEADLLTKDYVTNIFLISLSSILNNSSTVNAVGVFHKRLTAHKKSYVPLFQRASSTFTFLSPSVPLNQD